MDHDNNNKSSFYSSRDLFISAYLNYLNKVSNSENCSGKNKDLLLVYIKRLNEYKKISDVSSDEFTEFIHYISEEYNFLKQKFPYLNIEFEGRIKSPLSTDSKIKKDLADSVKLGENLDSITLKDILAYRYVVSFPDNFQSTEIDNIRACYDVLKAQIEFNLSKNHTMLEAKHPPKADSYTISKLAMENKIYVPNQSLAGEYSKYVKDYIVNPKPNLYQALHIRYAISGIPFETQIKTKQMHEYAEHGGASHSNYKPQKNFNIYRVPQEFKFNTANSQIDILSMDDSIKKYYGYSFKDIYGISYNEFLEKYSFAEQFKLLKSSAQSIDVPDFV